MPVTALTPRRGTCPLRTAVAQASQRCPTAPSCFTSTPARSRVSRRGLDRIDQGALPLSGTYTYTSTGAGVHAYIIDTGIWTLHPEFGGRANNVFDAYHATGEDCNGHGTHVNSDVIAGVDWVSANHVNPAVANESPSGAPSVFTVAASEKTDAKAS